MANPQLVEYIRREMAAGIAKDEIIRVLATTGWQQDAIQEAFVSLPAAGSDPVKVSAPTVDASRVEKHVGRWLLIATGVVLLLALLGGFVAYAFGLLTPIDERRDTPSTTATTTLPVASSTPDLVTPVVTPTATTTIPIVSPLATSTISVSTTPVVCTTQECLIANFSTCALASYTTDMGILTTAQYRILGAVPGGCSMSFVYTKNLNASWVNKPMTCTFDNKLEFNASVNNTFTLALAGKSSCVGTLATLLKTPQTPPKP